MHKISLDKKGTLILHCPGWGISSNFHCPRDCANDFIGKVLLHISHKLEDDGMPLNLTITRDCS